MPNPGLTGLLFGATPGLVHIKMKYLVLVNLVVWFNLFVSISYSCNIHTFGILADARINPEADSRPGGHSNEEEIQFYPILM